MALFTNFPGQNPFYGGLTLEYGTGVHVDKDATTGKEEPILADYLNRVELRLQRMERMFNQMEHEVLYPSGSVATSGFTESIPASGNYYIRSRIDVHASGINRLVQILEDNGTIPADVVNYYPFYVGNLS